MSRKLAQTRSMKSELKTRAEPEAEEMIIEGYFAVCGSETKLWEGAYEEIAIGAFDETLGNDIRALVNHDTTLVLGRNKAGTLELKADSHGLWGSIKINQKDSDAVNLYERVKRGDVTECSFGFSIEQEKTEWREDGSVKWTLEKVDIHEVSICTFPAYEDTGVQAREKDFKALQQRKLEARKIKLREVAKKWHLNN